MLSPERQSTLTSNNTK